MSKIRIITLVFLLATSSAFSAYSQQSNTSHITTNETTENIFHHTIERGQTVYSIATMYGVSQEDIYRLNPDSKESIKADAVLIIPQRKTASVVTSTTDEVYTYHTIQPKETLYSLTIKHNIQAEKIIEANPGLSVATFNIGKTIRIPVTAIESLPEKEVIITSDDIEYKVQRRETLYNISRRFNISTDELIRKNPELEKGMKAGMIIKVPVHTQEEVLVQQPQEAEVNSLLNAPKEIRHVNMINIALLLPFKAEEPVVSDATARFVEYYEGLLLAVDSLRNTGVSVKLSVFDTGEGTQKTVDVLKKKELKEANLIIGAVQSDQIKLVADFAKKNEIKYVIPFTSRNDDVLSNDAVFQVNTPHSHLYAKAAQVGCDLFAEYNIILLDTAEEGESNKNDKADFIATFKHEMELRNIPFNEHRLVVETFQTDLDSLWLITEKPNVIVPLSGSFEALNKIKAQLRGLSETNPEYRLTLFGYPEWQTYTKDALDDFFALNTYIYSNFYADNMSNEIHDFYVKYKTWYSKSLINSFPKYGILGFDTGMFFIGAMNKYGANFENNLKNINHSGLQTSFDFNRVNNWGGFINTQLFIVHYNKDFTITRKEVNL